jgi:hypothetical protein
MRWSVIARHALVRHQHADFVLMLFEQAEAIRGVRGCIDAKMFVESARKIFQRLLFVIDVKDRELLIVVEAMHHKIKRLKPAPPG